MSGYFSLVLHTHLPYVRKNGAWPVGEDWLYQAMSDTYLPLIALLEDLRDEGYRHCLALTLTPVLCEQLADDYVKVRFEAYLETMFEHANRDIDDFKYFGDSRRLAMAEVHLRSFEDKLERFRRVDGDILGAFAGLESDGVIETIGSCATHAFLPAQKFELAARNQVLLGIESHGRHLGRAPVGFWLPECAYRRGIEELLDEEGIRYVPVDSSALGGLPGTVPYLVAGSRVAALSRSDRAHADVWDDASGFPTSGAYLDSTKYYHGSGLLYWSVTGRDVPIDRKSLYEPEAAEALLLEHARHFVNGVKAELQLSTGNRPVVLASFDTELFGHGWREGVAWLGSVLRLLGGEAAVTVTVPSRYLEANPASDPVELAETTWGSNHDDSTWVNDETAWMWDELYRSQSELFELAELLRTGGGGGASRSLLQAWREVLLLESSDWPYMVAKDRARQYSTQRFDSHRERFWSLAEALREREVGLKRARLLEIEETDNVFEGLDASLLARGAGPRRSG